MDWVKAVFAWLSPRFAADALKEQGGKEGLDAPAPVGGVSSLLDPWG